MLEFTRCSKQWYWRSDEERDDISIEDSYKDNGCKWSLSLVEIVLSDHETAVKVEMFDDAVCALKNKKLVKALIALDDCCTLDKAEIILKRNGIKEVITLKR